mgnify:CR=1 FL=1
MKKDWSKRKSIRWIFKRKVLFKINVSFLLIICALLQVNAETLAQQRINLKLQSVTLDRVFQELSNQLKYEFLYNHSVAKTKGPITLDVKDKDLHSLLNEILTPWNMEYVLDESTIIVREKLNPQNHSQIPKIVVKGKVTDKKNNVLAGVSVFVKGTTVGVVSDADGNYQIEIPQMDEIILIWSFVGMKSFEKEISTNQTTHNIDVILEEETKEIEEVVVTAYFERNKDSFTGALKTVTGDDLRKISTTNIFAALSVLDPSIQIKPNNTQGSNPNNLPDIIIRGTSSLNASQTVGVNAPLIVIDGVESTIQALYDMDIFDIASVTTLKDASATALYGEQAANGVILVTRKNNIQKELRLSYSMTGKVDFPDLSAYDLMDAREKLDFELKSGLYGDPNNDANYTGEDYVNVYLPKLALVNSGINTDWLAKPLRNAFSHNHSLNLSGEGSGLTYQLTANYGDTKGVMKADSRKRFGFGAYFSYNYNQKLIFTLRANYAQTNVKNSKYGSFSQYAMANPYDAPYGADGKLRQYLSYNLRNPLYEASLSSFSTSKAKQYTINLTGRWNIIKGFFISGTANITNIDSRNDDYTSPLSHKYSQEVDAAKKGMYTITSSESIAYSGRITFNFNQNLDELGSMISVNAGGEINKDKNSPYSFSAQGFLNDKLTDITFAHQYPTNTSPNGQSDISTRVAFISAANIIYRGRYFIDGSLRFSGSSKFGKNQRCEPYWSTGIGWNIHRESWFTNTDAVNLLRLHASYGHTGSLNFASYQSITTYRYDAELNGKVSTGAVPITLGNQDLKAQVTKNINIGVTSSLLKERLEVNFDYYNDRTVDMIVPISMPYSSGVTTVSSNVGEQLNRGFEFSLSGVIINQKDWYCRLNLNGAKNYNELVKIGDVLRSQNSENAAKLSTSPTQLYIEGKSSTTLYAVRSAGIDPADGQEIFITKDGKYTKVYNADDKVALGDTEPKLRGSISAMLAYKNFSFNINAQYSLGGYIYNSTRADKVELINAKYNADRRAYTKRWEKPGDVVEYVNKKSGESTTNIHSSRFVEKENYLTIPAMSFSYQFNRDLVKKWGFHDLNLNLSLNDIAYFSTIVRERGTSYPFARNISFTISARF